MYIGKTDSPGHSAAKLLFRAVLSYPFKALRLFPPSASTREEKARRCFSNPKSTENDMCHRRAWTLLEIGSLPPTPPHTPFVPGKINISEELGKGVTPDGETRREGRAHPLPADGAALRETGGKGPGLGRAGGRSRAGGSLWLRERGAPSPEERRRRQSCRVGPAAPPGAGKGPWLQPGGGSGGRELRGGRDLAVRPRGPGPGQGPGRRTARSLRRAGPYFAAETLLSADNGAGCLLRAGRQLAIHRERCVTQMSRGS